MARRTIQTVPGLLPQRAGAIIQEQALAPFPVRRPGEHYGLNRAQFAHAHYYDRASTRFNRKMPIDQLIDELVDNDIIDADGDEKPDRILPPGVERNPNCKPRGDPKYNIRDCYIISSTWGPAKKPGPPKPDPGFKRGSTGEILSVSLLVNEDDLRTTNRTQTAVLPARIWITGASVIVGVHAAGSNVLGTVSLLGVGQLLNVSVHSQNDYLTESRQVACDVYRHIATQVIIKLEAGANVLLTGCSLDAIISYTPAVRA